MAQTNREQTREQFSTSTTADGNRLDRAMRDIVAWWNAIPKRNRQRKYVQTQLVGGFMQSVGVVRQLPFLSVMNSAYFSSLLAGETRNFWRFKGTRNNTIDPVTADPTLNRIIAWGPRIAFPKGAILDGIQVCLDLDGGVAPTCTLVGSDLTVIVDVDDRWTPDLKRFTLVQYLFNRLDLRAFWSINDAIVGSALVNTMLPPHWGTIIRVFAGFWGFCLEERGLGIALPELARVRIGIVIPRYNGGGSGWTATPWDAGSWSWTATFLEEVE